MTHKSHDIRHRQSMWNEIRLPNEWKKETENKKGEKRAEKIGGEKKRNTADIIYEIV